jgi:hypothetical protein
VTAQRAAWRHGLTIAAAALLVCWAALAAGAPAAFAAPSLAIEVLSTRADLVSGGQALAAIELPRGTAGVPVRVELNGQDVSNEFATRPNGQFEGLLTGLREGSNVLSASAGPAGSRQITIVNHPIGGPLVSGPQIQPWVCQAGAIDAKCDQSASYAYYYVPVGTTNVPSTVAPTVGPVNQPGTVGGATFASYDPANPPPASAIASTTTDNGQTVPYIVRVETGYMDRDQYANAVLYDPHVVWAPWAPQPQFNHKLVITHGSGCGADRTAGTAPDVLDDAALSRGLAVLSTALDNAQHNCNVVTEAESLIMAKEHFIDEYGTLRYTIGVGCSGGALAMQQVANAYPGIYQGIVPQCSFPDTWSTGQQMIDLQLLRNYLESPTVWSTGVVWTPAQIAAVEGNPNHANSVIFTTALWSALADPTSACAGVTAAQRYNPATNPSGVRCDVADYMINVFGLAPGQPYGFAGRPLDNVGVQYGVNALLAGQISPAQFADLNKQVGGYNLDARPTASRVAADEPALTNAYRDGAVNETNNLRDVAIIDLRGTDQGEFHDVYRAFAIRARLQAENGTFANQVIWEGVEPTFGDVGYPTAGFLAMDRWLSRVEADHGRSPLAKKLIQDRPSDVHDQCSDGAGQVIPNQRVCQLINPVFSTPRIVAGESVATDVMRCQRKPLTAASYPGINFSTQEWTQLIQAFPTGACDFSKPGVEQQPTTPWMNYQDSAGNVIYGGRPLGQAPRGSGGGWTSSSFASWRTAAVPHGGVRGQP